MREASEDLENHFMTLALKEAQKAFNKDEVPIGAVITCNNQILCKAHNICEHKKNPLKHAEMIAIEKACKTLNNWRLNDCEIYVTLEPCPMCLGALFQARIGKLIFGCPDSKRSKSKSSESNFESLIDKKTLIDNNHRMTIKSGVLEKDCSEMLRKFFQLKRKKA